MHTSRVGQQTGAELDLPGPFYKWEPARSCMGGVRGTLRDFRENREFSYKPGKPLIGAEVWI